MEQPGDFGSGPGCAVRRDVLQRKVSRGCEQVDSGSEILFADLQPGSGVASASSLQGPSWMASTSPKPTGCLFLGSSVQL
eukprot:989992-Karenia_brevis.AAC.1